MEDLSSQNNNLIQSVKLNKTSNSDTTSASNTKEKIAKYLNDSPDKETFLYFFITINQFLKHRQYRQTILLIKEKEKDSTLKLNSYLRIIWFDLKMKCYDKLLNKLIDKITPINYNAANIEVNIYKKNELLKRIDKQEGYRKNADTWFNHVEREVKQIGIKINKSLQLQQTKVDKGFYKEIIIKHYITLLYQRARFCMIHNQHQDAMAYLTISNNLITIIIDNCKDPDTFHIFQKIILMITSLLIQDNAYKNAIEFNCACLKLCTKEMFIRFNIEENHVSYIDMDSFTDLGRLQFIEIIHNILINLYQWGMSFENVNEIVRAIEAYKQCRWFSFKYFWKVSPKFFQIARQTEAMAFSYFEYFQKKSVKEEWQHKMKEEEYLRKWIHKQKDKKLSNIANGIVHDIEEKKHEEIERRINKMKGAVLKEPQTMNTNTHKSGIANYLLSAMDWYNDLWSNQYQEFWIKTKNVYYNKCTQDVEYSWNEYNNKWYNMQRIRWLKKQASQNNPGLTREDINTGKKKNSINRMAFLHKSNGLIKSHSVTGISEKRTNNTNIRNYMNNIKQRPFSPIQSNISISSTNTNMNGNKTKAHISSGFKGISYDVDTHFNKNNSIHWTKATPSMKRSVKNKDFVERLKCSDKFIFNKKCKNKRNYLEKMNNKETLFQKKILELKREEKFNYVKKEIRPEGMKKEADRLYKEIKMEKSKSMLYESPKAMKHDPIAWWHFKKKKIEESAITGLNPKKLVSISQWEEEETRIKNEQNKKFFCAIYCNDNKVQWEKFNKDWKDVKKTNDLILAELNQDIQGVEEKQNHMKKNN